MVEKSRLARNALANVLQALVSAGLLFALYRYINGVLGVAQLGVWSVVIATVSASRLADMGLSAGVTRFVARDQGRSDPLRATQVIDTATLTLMMAVGLLLPVFHYLVGKALPYLFEQGNLQDARAILPLALASLWLTIVASVFQGGLDGCQRMGVRAGLALSSQLLLLLLSVGLVPAYGLAGLAWAQIGQGAFLVLGGRLLLRKVMPEMSWLPWRWNRAVLREMLGYGANLQAGTLFILLFDPVTKALMARFGGATSAGYLEMASQVVLKVRALIVTANQAVVPHVAGWTDSDSAKVAHFYRKNTRVLAFVTLPVVALLMAAGPLFSWLLTGDYRSEFVAVLLILAIAWGFNILASPAYFINLGTGNVGANTAAHAATAIVSCVLALLMGPHFGAVGIMAGYVGGILTGSALLIIGFKRRHHIHMDFADGREHVWLFGAFLLVAAWAATALLHPSLRDSNISGAAPLFALLLMGAAAWIHTARRELFERFSTSTEVKL